MGRFDNKVALITGGTSGIGYATAELLLQEGATVIITGRNISNGKNAVEKLIHATKNPKISFFPCDVANESEIKSLRNYVNETFGVLNILFNNAGILLTGTLEELTDEDWDSSYDINVKGLMMMCRNFIDLLKQNHGVILNNASIAGLSSGKGKKTYAYASSKAAAIQFTRHIARNYAPYIRANVLCPGNTITNIFTNRDFSRFDDANLLGRMADPKEIARVACFLLSEDSSFMTGSVIVADGGESIK